MSFPRRYPQLTGKTIEEQIDEIYSEIVKLERNLDFELANIDSRNLNRTLGNDVQRLDSLVKTVDALKASVDNIVGDLYRSRYINIGDDGFTGYRGGFRLKKGIREIQSKDVMALDDTGAIKVNQLSDDEPHSIVVGAKSDLYELVVDASNAVQIRRYNDDGILQNTYELMVTNIT